MGTDDPGKLLREQIHQSTEGFVTALEIGPMHGDYISRLNHIPLRMAVEAWEPYVTAWGHPDVHIEHDRGEDWILSHKSTRWDVILLLDVIEHIEKDRAAEMLEMCIGLARQVHVYTTDGFIPNRHLSENPLQEHVSGFTRDELFGFDANAEITEVTEPNLITIKGKRTSDPQPMLYAVYNR